MALSAESRGSEATASPPTRPELSRPRASQHPSWSGLILREPGQVHEFFEPPSIKWLEGTWHFTHSTLPIWKDKRNVTITYNIVAPGNGQSKEQLDDLVEYQELNNDKIKSVRGRNVESTDNNAGAWNWRGKGIIKVASSHWDVLGWGVDNYAKKPGVPSDEHLWMVTYFIKTIFTPAAIDIYSRHPEGLSEEMVAEILKALARIDNAHLQDLTNQLYECKRDNSRFPVRP